MFKKKNNETITISRDDFREAIAEVLANPFRDKDIPEEDKAKVQLTLMMTGIMLAKVLEDELFGEE